MNTRNNFARFRHWPVSAGLLAVACLLSGTALAQRPSIAAQQAQIATLQSQVASLQANNVPGLASYLAVDTSTPTRPVVRVTAANFQVVNGLNNTGYINGLGNVIVGYDEASGIAGLPAVCSLGQYANQSPCTSAGGTWSVEHKEGSHNLVVGPYHRYSRSSGLIGGSSNTLNGDYASITGGTVNTASGFHAAISGGRQHNASGEFSSVSGGFGNTASNQYASVSGGTDNLASGQHSSVSGGSGNSAFGVVASVSGGSLNIASGDAASVSGGGSRSVSTNLFWVGGNSLAPQ